MKKIAIAAMAVPLALALAGCSGGNANDADKPDNAQSPQQAEQQAAQKDFDGSQFAETPEGEMYIATSGGTSQNGNVPKIAAGNNSLMQIEMDADGFNGEICTLYVDGMKVDEMNVGRTQKTISITGEQLAKGTHTVELVSMDGDAPAIYKLAKYEIA